MDNIPAIPSLTLDGFITNKSAQMKKLFEYFLASEYSQSNTFQGKISSLQFILANDKDTIATVDLIRTTLISLYKSCFDIVDVVVNYDESDSSSTVNYSIDITCKHEDMYYSLNKDIREKNSKIDNYDELLRALYEEE